MVKKRLLFLLLLPTVLLVIIGTDSLSFAAAAPNSPDSPLSSLSMVFDGVNDRIEIPHSATLNPTGSAFTIEAWIKRDNDIRCETLIGKNYTTAYWLGFCGQSIRFYASGSGSALDGTTAIPANVWTHIAVVYAGAGRRYYVNGELDFVAGPEVAPTANTGPIYIGADPSGGGSFFFDGRLSNVRFWNVARTQEQIRRWMHVAIAEPLPGLVANWTLDRDGVDNVGDHDGTLNGPTMLTGSPPGQPSFVPVDETFNTLPVLRLAAATAYIPYLDRVLMVGGQIGGVTLTDDVIAIDGASGNYALLGNLSSTLTDAAAAYVPSADKVYLFGGRNTSNASSVVDTIIAVDPASGAASPLAATLPQAVDQLAAVYDAENDRVLLFGGRTASTTLNSIWIFDPVSELVTPAGITLPQPIHGSEAAVAGGKVHLFGGFSSGVIDTIYAVDLAADGSSGSVTSLPAHLPMAETNMRAAVDMETQLVYLAGANPQNWLWVFDPLTAEIWETRIGLPTGTVKPSLAYSPPNRHLMIIGGSAGLTGTFRNVWRAPVGDGPMVPLGQWDFPQSVASQVNAIDGDESRVLVATDGSGAFVYHSSGVRSQYSPGGLGSASGVVNDVAYYSSNGTILIATDDAGAKVDNGSSVTTYNSTQFGTDRVLEVNPRGFFGTHDQGLFWRRQILFPTPHYVWENDFVSQRIASSSMDSANDLWVIADNSLKKLDWALLGGVETNYGPRCGLSSLVDQMDLVVTANGEWWLVSPGDGEFAGDGICRIPAGATPGTGSSVTSLLGTQGTEVDVDAEERVWISVLSGSDTTGGLSVFGRSDLVGALRTSELNWLNAPLGSRTFRIGGVTLNRFWDSSLTSVGAADERIWTGSSTGRLVTLAQRWQQIDEANNIGSQIIENVWTVRGRAFMASSTTLNVLQPDGRTWDTRSSVKVWDVLADRQGRIWVATNTGIRLYTPGGWDYLTDKEGTRPSWATYSLAEDSLGRIWIGGLNGLTLFDRDRFVATFNTANSDLPNDKIRTQLVDSDDRLWVGTDLGLARLDGISWTLFTTTDGLPSNAIFDLEQLASGDIAISTSAGLAFYDGATLAPQTLPIPDTYLPLSVDETGRLWAGNAVLVGGSWEVYYTTDSGLASDEISDIASDGADRIWFSHAPDTGVSVRGNYLPPLDNAVPSIDNVLDQTGTAGDTVRISGTGFGTSSSLRVTIGGAPAEVVSVSPTEIVVQLTEENTSGDVSVQLGLRRAIAIDAFCAIPQIERITPTGGNDGVVVNIYGTNFDPLATVYLDGTNPHTPHIRGATQLGAIIEPGDSSGTLRVVNDCPIGSISDLTVSGYSSAVFQRISLSLEQMVLNQGIQSTGLVAGRPTMFQHYLSHSIPPRDTDAIEIDTIELTFTEAGSPPFTLRESYTEAVPTSGAAPAPVLLRDISNSVNLVMAPLLHGSRDPSNTVLVEAVMKRRSYTLAQGSANDHFRPDQPIRVLLVPITDNTPNDAERRAIRQTTNAGLDNLRRRIFPTGRAEFYWSPITYTADDLLMFSNDMVDVGNSLNLYDASHNLERARRWWNEHREPDVLIVYGVVDPAANSGTTPGLAFWPDMSQLLNAVALEPLDTLCDIGGAALSILTFGLAGGGCDLDIPLYVAWGNSVPDSSRLIGHEMGHVMGLVKPWAVNGDVGDNFSHSVNDELDGGECGSAGATYNVNKTLYRQPGVVDPVVNPLTAAQLLPLPGAGAAAGRGKALMSYACGRGNNNVFYEPADHPAIRAEYVLAGARGFVTDLAGGGVAATRPETASTAAPQAVPIPVAGDRIFVSGVVTPTAGTGAIRQVEILGGAAPLDASYVTGFYLVQKDGSGAELGRTGVFPVFRTSAGVSDAGFFAATILAKAGVAEIQLVHESSLLDSFSAGGSAPTISIGSPVGGTYASGDVPVAWSASDSDSDALSIAILFSPDDGATWIPVGFSSEATGGLGLPIDTLSGSSDARIKVVATDGLQTGEAVSALFKVAGQPPIPFIGAPIDGGILLEGQRVLLTGGATDNQDLIIPDDGLKWTSSRDGGLGTGGLISSTLSVGQHVLTLEASNSLGVLASTAVTVTVQGDYDYDGIGDSVELGSGLNILSSADALSDSDEDGLSLRVELDRGLLPDDDDSDNDGRLDGTEVADGSDPLTSDLPRPADSLTAYPSSLTFDVDLDLGVPMAQDQLALLSLRPMTWTLSADVSWLAATTAAGRTPDGVTIIVDTDRLPGSGTYTGNLFLDSPTGRVIVPVTVNAVNVISKLYLPVILRN